MFFSPLLYHLKNSLVASGPCTMNALASGLRNQLSRWEEGKSNLTAATKRGDCFSSPLAEVGRVRLGLEAAGWREKEREREKK